MSEYIGGELELFSHATQWKEYLFTQISPYLGSRVLEVGAGIGGTSLALCRGQHRDWVCLEPDATQVEQIRRLVSEGSLPRCCRPVHGMLGAAPALEGHAGFDTLLYIDVLEHIEQDAAELEKAAAHLVPGGHLVVLAPAHPLLYTPFDRAVGHFRRYTRASLLGTLPGGGVTVEAKYLDSCGLAASLGNRLLLRASMPTLQQVRFWDRVLVPMSRVVDPLACFAMGKSVLVVWRKGP